MDWFWHNYNRNKKYYQMARQEHGELQLECNRKPRDHNEPKHDSNSCTSFPRVFVSFLYRFKETKFVSMNIFRKKKFFLKHL